MPKFKVQLFELVAEEEIEVCSKSDVVPENLWPELAQIDDWNLHYFLHIEESEQEEIEEDTEDELFSPQEGFPKIGHKVRSGIPFSGIPAGTIGTVLRFADGILAIRWDLPERGRAVEDWFSKWEYEKYLEEIADD